MSTTFVDNPEKGRCYIQVSDHTGFHFLQCSRKAKYAMTDLVHRVEVCSQHRDLLLRRNKMWKTQWKELQSCEEYQAEQKARKGKTRQTRQMTTKGALAKLAEKIGWRQEAGGWHWLDHRGLIVSRDWDPLSSATDDYLVLEAMRNGNPGVYSDFKTALFHFDPPIKPWMWLYEIGAYTRAACKTHHILLPEEEK